VRPGTLLVLGHRQLRGDVIPALRIGDGVAISIDGVSGTEFRGRVENLSPASGAQFVLLPPDSAAGNFTRIVQRILVKVNFDSGHRP
jgi:membrane fusion protein (multidrug efflux system)